ncbi:MAG: hypothetical protein KatS3mg099_218 [Candidatus Parcubacteria bacterium]|nr:MAG: hypothetical protein KatS3mg099_218 [Candidatus Parcubacteria bacterium]
MASHLLRTRDPGFARPPRARAGRLRGAPQFESSRAEQKHSRRTLRVRLLVLRAREARSPVLSKFAAYGVSFAKNSRPRLRAPAPRTRGATSWRAQFESSRAAQKHSRRTLRVRLLVLRAREDSNPQPSGPKPDALSIELRARGYAIIFAMEKPKSPKGGEVPVPVAITAEDVRKTREVAERMLQDLTSVRLRLDAGGRASDLRHNSTNNLADTQRTGKQLDYSNSKPTQRTAYYRLASVSEYSPAPSAGAANVSRVLG